MVGSDSGNAFMRIKLYLNFCFISFDHFNIRVISCFQMNPNDLSHRFAGGPNEAGLRPRGLSRRNKGNENEVKVFDFVTNN